MRYAFLLIYPDGSTLQSEDCPGPEIAWQKLRDHLLVETQHIIKSAYIIVTGFEMSDIKPDGSLRFRGRKKENT